MASAAQLEYETAKLYIYIYIQRVHRGRSQEDITRQRPSRRSSSAKRSQEREEKSWTNEILINHQNQNQDGEIREGDRKRWMNDKSK